MAHNLPLPSLGTILTEVGNVYEHYRYTTNFDHSCLFRRDDLVIDHIEGFPYLLELRLIQVHLLLEVFLSLPEMVLLDDSEST